MKPYLDRKASNEDKSNKIDKFINELQLKVKDAEDKIQLSTILLNHLSYPDTQMALTHRNANKMGKNDLKVSLQQSKQQRFSHERCKCCEMIVHEQQIETWGAHLSEIIGLGTSTVVFFKTIINVIYLLMVMMLIYSIFSLVSNVSIAKSSDNISPSQSSASFLIFSLKQKSNQTVSSTQNGELYFYISSWLGVVMLFVWSLMFFCFQKEAVNYQMEQQRIRSVSDYSIIIENMPYGITKEELQDQLNKYIEGFHKKGICQDIQRIKIERYNVGHPFNFKVDDYKDSSLRKINEDIKNIKEQFREWIIERRSNSTFSKSKEYRTEKYQQMSKLQQEKKIKTDQIVKNMQTKLTQTSNGVLTSVFVTFQTVKQRNFMLYYNSNDMLSRIKRFFLSCFNCFYFSSRLKLYHEGNIYLNIRIEAASQPEDIIWGNIGVSECERISRTSLNFLLSIATLFLSLIIVVILSTIRFLNAESRYLSFLISLVISATDFLIISKNVNNLETVQLSTSFQRAISMNNYQISLTIKSVMALLLNSIVLPFLVNYFVKGKNIYNKGGLAEDIFILAMTSSFVPPLLRLVDPVYIYVTLRAKYYNRPEQKLYLNQAELNRLNEKMQFQLGGRYIYIINLFFFVCFYVSLQPIIPIFAIAGMILMYWIEKYTLLRRSQRPVPGTESITLSMYQMIYFGAICYALGSLTWSTFLPDDNFRNSLVPNIVSGCLALIIFVIPYPLFVKKGKNYAHNEPYEKQRIYFTSEYDRLNPATKEEAIRNFRSYIKQTTAKLNQMTQQQRKELIYNLQNKMYNNVYKNHNPANAIFGDQEDVEISNLFYSQCKNAINPNQIISIIINQSSISFQQEQSHEIILKVNDTTKKEPRRDKLRMNSLKNAFCDESNRQKETEYVDKLNKENYLSNIQQEDEEDNLPSNIKMIN